MEKKQYIKPELTVVSVKAERGYAASGLLDALMFWNNDGDPVERYDDRSGWGSSSDDNHFWGD